MQAHDRKEFLEIVIGFAELKGKTLSAPGLEMYWRAMQEWSLEDFRAAAQQLVRTAKFFPTPFDFEELRRAGRPTAGEAWATAVEAARHGGDCADPLVNRAVAAMGGWLVIRFSDEANLHFLERRFVDAYKDLESVNDTRVALPMLTPVNGSLSHEKIDQLMKKLKKLTVIAKDANK